MAIKAIREDFSGTITGLTTYNPSVHNFGSLIKRYTGLTYTDNFVGPMKIGLARPLEASVAVAGAYPHVHRFSENIDWVFLFENSTASATRRVVLYEFDRSSSVFSWKGVITVTFPTNTNHTIRGGRVVILPYTGGTVSGSSGGTAITGSDTTWTTDRMTVGSRIGFGSTNANEISNWYYISAVGSNTSITLTTPLLSTISAGTPYVIEDMKIIITTTNATATNGGLFVVKGCSYADFIVQTIVPAATTTDNKKAVYWLADAATVTNTAAGGAAIENFVDWTTQYVYVINTTTNIRVFKYNFRRALSPTTGRDNNTLVLQTGNQALTGTVSATNNGRIGALNHGPLAGVNSLYFVTTTRCYGTPISAITSGSTTWAQNAMVEIPPGSVNTYAATGALALVEIASSIDRLILMSTGAAGARSYITRFNTVSDQFDHIFLVDDKQLDQSSADSDGVVHPTINATAFSVWSEAGVAYLCRNGTTAALNQLYAIPIEAHRAYSDITNQNLITKKYSLSDVNKLYAIYVNSFQELGSDTFSLPPEPYDVYYRTSGIDDNSGSWVKINADGDISAASGSFIQFMFKFRTIGGYSVPARVINFSIVYEDNSTDSHYEPSINNSSVQNRIFAYRQSTAWGSSIPNMRIRLYNASTGVIVIDDNVTSSSFGTWQYSTDGGSNWLSWNSSADVVGNYIRYTATSLPNGVRIRAVLTQA